MKYAVLLLAVVVPLIAAHGKIAAVRGNAGGNGTALAIRGAIVPGPGKNKVTEVDTTVFGSTKIATDGLGKTTGTGKNTVAMVAQSMALSGDTLPQVSQNDGSITGTVHIVTTDGAGPYRAIIDPTGTGKFSTGTRAKVTEQVPGKKGNINADGTVKSKKRLITGRALEKRAANVNRDFPIKINVPAGTTCTGSIAGKDNVCLMKIANSNPAGPFGGVIAFQMADTVATSTKREAEEQFREVDEEDFDIEEEDEE